MDNTPTPAEEVKMELLVSDKDITRRAKAQGDAMMDLHGDDFAAGERSRGYINGGVDVRNIYELSRTRLTKELIEEREKSARMREALTTIEQWFDQFPVTGKTWDDGSPMSYGAAYGSNGERDFMRSIARKALNP